MVGVAKDAKQAGWTTPIAGEMYLPFLPAILRGIIYRVNAK